jgi:hypothetical protein
LRRGGDIAIITIGMATDRQTLDTFYDTFPGGWGWRWGSGYGDATTTTEAVLLGYRKEGDGDFHLVLQGPNDGNATMIAEIKARQAHDRQGLPLYQEAR